MTCPRRRQKRHPMPGVPMEEGIGVVVGIAKRQKSGTLVEGGTGMVTTRRRSGELVGMMREERSGELVAGLPQGTHSRLVNKEQQPSPPWWARIWRR